ncbi:MAG: rod shape-determining protein MreC [Bacteroidia bacterium]|nr:rod shape-determining protein MreC [Bacteroidia bacterium]
MQQIVNFLIRNKVFLLFLLLFCVSIFFTIQSHNYHKSKFIHSANFLTGGVYEKVSAINQYFNLKKENQKLLEENNRLKETLFNSSNELYRDFHFNYNVVSGYAIKNSYSYSDNYLTLNIGLNDSVFEDNGVITSKGIVGIIDKTSKNHSRVLSILNTISKVNAQLKKSNHFGILTWNGISPNTVQLTDIPKQAPVVVGDTIVTGGRSAIFPKGIPIGIVTSFSVDPTQNYLTLEVSLFNDMTNIGYVHVINNLNKEEILSLDISNE